MKQFVSYRAFASMLWVVIWAVLCSLGQFAPTVAAQIDTATPENTPTPTPTSTLTATPTATSNAAASERVVDFRVDDKEINAGECVIFSWVVRGDIDRIEFNQRDDFKDPVLVKESESREECPGKNTYYDLMVTWLDTTNTIRSIEVEIAGGGDGGGVGEGGTPLPPPGTFVSVSPIPAAIITPAGPLGSVRVLPETGASPQPSTDTRQSLLGGLAVSLGIALISLALVLKATRESEVPDES